MGGELYLRGYLVMRLIADYRWSNRSEAFGLNSKVSSELKPCSSY